MQPEPECLWAFAQERGCGEVDFLTGTQKMVHWRIRSLKVDFGWGWGCGVDILDRGAFCVWDSLFLLPGRGHFAHIYAPFGMAIVYVIYCQCAVNQ